MIDRYFMQEFKILWSDFNRFNTMYKVELAAAKAMEDEDIIPKGTHEELSKFVMPYNIADLVKSLEETKQHETVAFISYIESKIDKKYSKYLHYGLTSSDVLDTTQALLLKDSIDLLINHLNKLYFALREKAEKHKDTKIMGRSHGMHAEITTYGNILNGYIEELKRNERRLILAKDTISVGKLSGAVGNYLHLPKEVEFVALNSLGLQVEEFATQVVCRDRYAEVFGVCGLVASSLERIAVNIRHMQRQEVSEVAEGFSNGQAGSSAMPHKRNPILSENICGLARIVRSYVNVSYENMSLWHERDMSHSSAERYMCVDATSTLGFMIHRMTQVIDNLYVNKENMYKNISLNNGNFASQKLLLKLIQNGLSREDSYKLVQNVSFKASSYKLHLKVIASDDVELLKTLSKSEILECFNY